jgi:plastocyanin domain-containing protein
MSFDKIFVLIFGLIGVIFTFWFFFMKKSKKAREVQGEVRITVDGGYNPDVISVPIGKPTKIIFFRKDPSSCLEEVVLPDFKIKKYLPLNEEVTIEITPNKTGEFEIVCGMNMFHGRIIVN